MAIKKGDKIKVTFYGSSSHVGFEGSEDEVYGGQGNEIIYTGQEAGERVTVHTVIESNAVVAKPKYERGRPIENTVGEIDFDPEKSNTTKLYKCPTKETHINQSKIDDGTCKLLATKKPEEERGEDDPLWDISEDEEITKTVPESFLQELAKPGSDANTKVNDAQDSMLKLHETFVTDDSVAEALKSEKEKKVKEEEKAEQSNEALSEGLTQSASAKARDSYSKSAIRYPFDLDPKVQDFIKFGILKYKPTKFEGSGLQMGFSDRDIRRKTSEYIGTIILPIPGGIRDQNQVDWGGDELNAFKATLANLALQGQNPLSIDDFAKKFTGNSEAVIKALKATFANRALGTKSLLSRTEGKVINPNLELLFNGPKLRQFSFDFFLSPRSADEAQNVIKIIRMFKQASAVQRTDARIFLSAPNTFQVTYHMADSGIDDTFESREHPYIGKMKECAITSVGVEYTPENNFARFDKGYMTQYKLSLQMQELEPIFNNDYDDPNFNNENNQTYANSKQDWTGNIGF